MKVKYFTIILALLAFLYTITFNKITIQPLTSDETKWEYLIVDIHPYLKIQKNEVRVIEGGKRLSENDKYIIRKDLFEIHIKRYGDKEISGKSPSTGLNGKKLSELSDDDKTRYLGSEYPRLIKDLDDYFQSGGVLIGHNKVLNELGEKGWEIVQLTNGGDIIFKRRVADTSSQRINISKVFEFLKSQSQETKQ